MMSTRMYVCESGEHPSSLLSGLNEQRLKVYCAPIVVHLCVTSKYQIYVLLFQD